MSITVPTPEHFLRLGDRIAAERATRFALPCYRSAFAMAPTDIKTGLKLTTALSNCQEYEEEEQVLLSMYNAQPTNERLFFRLGSLLEVQNRLTDLQTFLRDAPTAVQATCKYLRLSGECNWRLGQPDAACVDLTRALEQTTDARELSSIHYLLAKALDAKQDYDQAFHHIATASQLRLELSDFDAESNLYRSQIAELTAWADSSENSDHLRQDAAPQPNTPIFVTGFPRSGNTLMGRILDAHPECSATSEHAAVRAVIQELEFRGMDYPTCVNSLDDEQLNTLRQRYWDVLGTGNSLRRIDVFPLNIIHLPLIWKLFPAAKVMVMVRHPLDVCLSCYSQNFSDSPAMHNFLELSSTAETYNEVMSLLKHYRASNGDLIHMVRYEQLTTNFQDTMSAATAFCGLTFSKDMEAFHLRAQQARTVRTASYHQVVKPLYRSSKGRWQNYSKHLDDIKPTLNEWCSEYGYESEGSDRVES